MVVVSWWETTATRCPGLEVATVPKWETIVAKCQVKRDELCYEAMPSQNYHKARCQAKGGMLCNDATQGRNMNDKKTEPMVLNQEKESIIRH
jgi:hypothetical protein